MICVYRTNDPVSLEYAKQLLQRHDILTVVKNADFRGSAAGEVPPVVAQTELCVHPKEAEQADKLLASMRRELKVVRESWRCSCGEVLEGNFQVCWSCGTAREDVAL